MNPRPMIDVDITTLPAEPEGRHEALVNFFGQHLFWCRGQATEFVQRAVSSPEVRHRLGRIPAKPYASVAELSEEAREAALNLARVSIDHFMQLIMVLFTTMSADQRLGQDHAIRYKIIMEIIERKDRHLVLEEIVNRDGEKVFSEYFGRWLNHDHAANATRPGEETREG